jgi:hypothetical protein
MEPKNDSDDSCLWSLIGLGFVAFIIYGIGRIFYDTWQFFQRPDAFARTIETLQACGICLGLIVLVIVIMIILPYRKPDYTNEDIDDFYRN